MSAEHQHGSDCPMEPRSNAELVVRQDILEKAKELAQLISSSDEVETYQKAEKMINGNERVQSLIKLIKKKQKEIVGFEYFQNEQMVKKIEGEIADLQDELDGIPLVGQFQQTQADINYLLQLTISVIKDTVSERINVSMGSETPPESCSD